MKTDEQILEDRLALFETDGWKDLLEDLKNIEHSVRDVDTMESEKDLWHAKGQLHIINYLFSLEPATQLAVEQSQIGTPL